ncbi:phosphoribosyltransferase [Mesomycoplasma hyopneumoniae]|uniref:phosphoribosyltransferase n=1 Tax=Mesomycoplasma hyopneumoniae TaxID=2099 RepID=UPI001F4E3F01|nr:phosphoribosyltransferase family protein [Mesomycoplasma hyopneumoniae]
MINKHISQILYNRDQIKARIAEIGKWINETYKDSNEIVFIGVLKGSLIFLTELIQSVDVDSMVDFVIAKSYFGGSESTGELKVITDIDIQILLVF